MKYRMLLLLTTLLVLTGSSSLANDEVTHRYEALKPLERDEVLWLARCIYSESDRAHEQRLVAWVVRNRVETEYRGNTYREVVLEPKQFSAFNTPTPRRERILKLDIASKSATWRRALGIALDVFEAPAVTRPFSIQTRHFYSPISMVGRSEPAWAENATPLDNTALEVDPQRFLFFEDIDELKDPYIVEQTPELQERPSTEARIAEKQDRVRERQTRLRSRLRFSGKIQRPSRPIPRSSQHP